MKIRLSILFVLFFLFSPVALGQEKKDPLKSITSETRYVDEYPFKKRVWSFGFSAQSDVFDDDSPGVFFIKSGYDYRKYYDNYNLYWGVGPRVNFGWMTGNQGVGSWNYVSEFSFDSFVWGASIAPSIGLILSSESYIGVYLEGELGVLNYHTGGKLVGIETPTLKKYSNDYLRLNLALRAGLRGDFSSKLEGAVWVGLSNINTKDAIRKIHFQDYSVEQFSLFGEIGVSIGF